MTIKMKAPHGCAAISINGETYSVNGDIAIIPKKLMHEAIEHGFKKLDKSELLEEEKLDKANKKTAKKGD